MHTIDILKSCKFSESHFKNSIKTRVLQMATPWISEVAINQNARSQEKKDSSLTLSLQMNFKYPISPDKRLYCA